MNSKATKRDGKPTTHSLKDYPLLFVVKPFWFARVWPIWPNCLPGATTLREELYLLAQVPIHIELARKLPQNRLKCIIQEHIRPRKKVRIRNNEYLFRKFMPPHWTLESSARGLIIFKISNLVVRSYEFYRNHWFF